MMILSILWPTFVLVSLTFLAIFWEGRGGKPVESGWYGHHLHTLFYVLVVLAIETKHADLILVLLAWMFVALQIFQAGFFNINSRGLFIAGALVLLAMWVYYALRVLFLI